MNKRIKELAQNSGFRYNGGWVFADDADVVEFAKQVVEECVVFLSCAVEVHTQADQDVCARAAKGLKNYFELNNE